MNTSTLIKRAEAFMQKFEEKNKPKEPLSDEMNLCLKLYGMVVKHKFDTLPDYEGDWFVENEAILSMGGIEVVCEMARAKVMNGGISEQEKQDCICLIDSCEKYYYSI